MPSDDPAAGDVEADTKLLGLRGPTGPSGPTGTTGAAGVSGPQGLQGVPGDTGPAGPAGADSQVPGPTGDTGPTGPAGAQGVPGSAGAPVVRWGIPTSGSPNEFLTSSASCHGEGHAVGGGYRFEIFGGSVYPQYVSSYPDATDGDKPEGWLVTVRLASELPSDTGVGQVQVYALCVPD